VSGQVWLQKKDGKQGEKMNELEYESIVSLLDQESRQMRARMERLESENQSAQDTIARLMLEINRLHNEKI